MTSMLAFVLLFVWPFSDSEFKDEIFELHNQAKIQFKTNPDSALSLIQTALYKSEVSGYSFGVAKSKFLQGAMVNKQGKGALATAFFLGALKSYETIDSQEANTDRAKLYLELGNIFLKYNKTTEAIEMYKKGIDLSEQIVSKKIVRKLMHNLVVAHRTIKDYGAAIDLLTKILESIDHESLPDRLHTYNELALVYQSTKEYNHAHFWLDKIIACDSSVGSSYFRGQAWHNLANVYIEESKINDAWRCFEYALQEKIGLKDAKSLFITYQDMADLALAEGKFQLALAYALKAQPLLAKVPELPEYFDQYELLARCYESIDIGKSYLYSKTYGEKFRNFDLTQKELIAKIEGYKLDLVLAKHEKQVQQEALQARYVYTVIGLLIFSLVVYALMDYRRRRYRLHLLDTINFFIADQELMRRL